MRAEIIAAGETDPAAIASECGKEPAPPVKVFYQKHMTHHMLPGFPLDWIRSVSNAFLLRSPERVLSSYVQKHETVGASDIGFAMQRELFDRAAQASGKAPPVIDSTDIRRSPRASLTALCASLGIPFDEAMLSWKTGPAPEDGVWGIHWYDAIWKSTGFALPEQAVPQLPPHLARIADEVRADYEHLKAYRLKI